MAKGDFTNTTIRNGYKNLIPTKTLSKVTVASDEKRDRAELLDIVEELFQTKSGGITAEKLRALLHMLVKSVGNTSDDTSLALGATSATALRGDTTTISTAQANEVTANNAKVSFPLSPMRDGQTLNFALNGTGNKLLITAVTGKTVRRVELTLS